VLVEGGVDEFGGDFEGVGDRGGGKAVVVEFEDGAGVVAGGGDLGEGLGLVQGGGGGVGVGAEVEGTNIDGFFGIDRGRGGVDDAAFDRGFEVGFFDGFAKEGGEEFPEAVGFVFDVAFGAVAGLGDVGVLVALEDSLEDGDLEGVEVVAGVVVDEGV